jgi:hypothetical protein
MRRAFQQHLDVPDQGTECTVVDAAVSKCPVSHAMHVKSFSSHRFVFQEGKMLEPIVQSFGGIYIRTATVSSL